MKNRIHIATLLQLLQLQLSLQQGENGRYVSENIVR